jgi:hypothetical protein
MISIRSLFACTVFCLGLSTVAFAGSNAALTTNPSPPPADQDFEAVFHVTTNVGASGFWGEAFPMTEMDGNAITIHFDEGCGFICQTNDQAPGHFPFMMRALPAGAYVVRFVSPENGLLGAFNINVGIGGGGGAAPASLPVGGYWNLLFAVLIALVAGTRLIVRQVKREPTI